MRTGFLDAPVPAHTVPCTGGMTAPSFSLTVVDYFPRGHITDHPVLGGLEQQKSILRGVGRATLPPEAPARTCPPTPAASSGGQGPWCSLAQPRITPVSTFLFTWLSLLWICMEFRVSSPLTMRAPVTGCWTHSHQYDLILTNSICKSRVQTRSRSEVPGGHELWGALLSPPGVVG